MARRIADDPESTRLREDTERSKNWKRWGPYLSERQWGTVREDYSKDGNCWDYFPHEHARSRAYRWGEDGLLGFTDRQCRTCFAIALWNGRDPILKERLFGLTNPEANHGEDVKEQYFYLESTPTHSYVRSLYKYPQAEFPYARLLAEGRQRSRKELEFELADAGVFDAGRYFDVFVEYAKQSPDDVLVRITVHNRGDQAAVLHVLPTIWFRNAWSWGCNQEGCAVRPRVRRGDDLLVHVDEPSLGPMRLALDRIPGAGAPELLFTENETNVQRLYGSENVVPHVKDAFHEYVVRGDKQAVSDKPHGTKSAWNVRFEIEAGGSRTLRLRLFSGAQAPKKLFGPDFENVFETRRREHDQFYAAKAPGTLTADESNVVRQAYAGLLQSKQFYHYAVNAWLEGDADQPPPPPERKSARNRDWRHVYNRDVISMPDKWEYPWYAAWDLAFHMIPMARVDPDFAKQQLLLFLREWYMHPNGQIPAYEFNFSDVNPPVHAWACWRVYKMTGPRGGRDRQFLARAFQKLLINFTWWVNRKDPFGNHLFAGGFLGLDNIGVFDRNRPLPGGGQLIQADGTAWMAFFCATMLSMAVELALEDPTYEDVASKFFEHFVAICDAMNRLGGTGLWHEEDGFYYDVMQIEGRPQAVRLRSMVGLVPLIAAEIITVEGLQRLPNFRRRTEWFLKNRHDLAETISYLEFDKSNGRGLLAIPSRARLLRVLRYVLDEREFLSPHGLRSMSRVHLEKPYSIRVAGEEFSAEYEAGESKHGIFGGNSNWRGPVWFPLNYLVIEALDRYHYFYGDSLKVECPVGSGRYMNLREVSLFLTARLSKLFLADGKGRRPCHAGDARFAQDPHWKDLVLFHEYFHGDDGRGLGASHQTGWTALAARCIEDLAESRETLRRAASHAPSPNAATAGSTAKARARSPRS